MERKNLKETEKVWSKLPPEIREPLAVIIQIKTSSERAHVTSLMLHLAHQFNRDLIRHRRLMKLWTLGVFFFFSGIILTIYIYFTV